MEAKTYRHVQDALADGTTGGFSFSFVRSSVKVWSAAKASLIAASSTCDASDWFLTGVYA